MPELTFTVDSSAAEPPYEQVRAAIAQAVESGSLTAGTKLPTVRALAAQLQIAVNTVARAYRELESAGVVETRGRAGTFVAGAGVQREARAAASAYVDRIRALGLSDADALSAVQRALHRGGSS